MALISIALATYNGEKYIEEQIKSILNQSFQDFEIVVQDDCSTDKTYDILKKLATIDNRIYLQKNDSNLGFAKNFEKIVSECKGKFIAFSDQDDIWEEKHLEILLSIIGEKDMACGNSLLVDQYNNSLGYTMKEVVGIENEPSKEGMQWRLFFDNFVQGTAMLVKKELCDKYLPVPEVVKYHDYWLALVASLNNGIAYTSEILLRYRQHGNNVTTNIKGTLFREVYNAFNGFNRKHFLRQVEILSCLEKVVGDVQEINEAKKFYIDCSRRKISNTDLKYFKDHYFEMFFTEKYYFLRKFIYLYM